MSNGHHIRALEEAAAFTKRLRGYPPESIIFTKHTFFRLSEKQREVYTEDRLRKILLEENPLLAGIQNNGHIAAFYKWEKQRFIRIIIDMRVDGVKIITFYIIEKDQMPRVKQL